MTSFINSAFHELTPTEEINFKNLRIIMEINIFDCHCFPLPACND